MLHPLILVAVGGASGAVSRYLFGLIAQKCLLFLPMSAHFPLATLFVNLLGAALLGIVIEVLAVHFTHLPDQLMHIRAAVAIGYLGSLTTFSTMIMDIVNLGQKQDWIFLGFYLGISLAGGIVCFVSGMRLGYFLAHLFT